MRLFQLIKTPSNPHPLASLSRNRERIIEEVIKRTFQQVTNVDEAIRDSTFWERKRLERRSEPVRDTQDSAFWKEIAAELNQQQITTAKQNELLRKIIYYHANEIAGNFNERTYVLASIVIPRIFTWLLRTLSWKSIRTLFSDKIDLRDRIYIGGQTELLKKLSQKGTIILVPTHFSNLDSLLVGWALYSQGVPPFCYGAGLNLFTNPVFGWFMNNLGAYKVDRKKKHALYKLILKNYSNIILEKGCHSLFFPTGGRSRSGGIGSRLKLGLLGTALEAYITNLINKKDNPNFYIVPCVISYHFVLEAATLVDDFLTETGKSRFIIEDDESSKPKIVAQFFYKFLTASSKIYLNVGTPLDPFGHLVDDDGDSINVHGSKIDITSFVQSDGKICHSPQRDQEYTRILGDKIIERYKKEYIALTSHFIAYSYFEFLRKKYSPHDLFRLFRLSEEETAVELELFLSYTSPILEKLHKLYDAGELLLEPALRSTNLKNILESAIRNIGLFHTSRPLKMVAEKLLCEDVKLLFYYHNRIEGYGLVSAEKPPQQRAR